MEKVNENILSGLAMTYSRLAPGDKHRTEILSVVAREYPNKELKQLFYSHMKTCKDKLSLVLVMN